MKITLLLVALCLAFGLASAVRYRPSEWQGGRKREVMVNRPKIGTFGPRERRWAWAGVKGGQVPQDAPTPLELKVRKGEYVCGNKICKLEPGVEPKNCHGVCQYPL